MTSKPRYLPDWFFVYVVISWFNLFTSWEAMLAEEVLKAPIKPRRSSIKWEHPRLTSNHLHHSSPLCSSNYSASLNGHLFSASDNRLSSPSIFLSIFLPKHNLIQSFSFSYLIYFSCLSKLATIIANLQ